MSHRKSDLGIPRPRKSAKVVLGFRASRRGVGRTPAAAAMSTASGKVLTPKRSMTLAR